MNINDKEELTKYHIITDLKKYYLEQIKSYGIGLAFSIFVSIFLVGIANELESTVSLIIVISWVVFLCAFLGGLFFYNLYNYFSVTKNFKFECDKLANKEIVTRVRHRHVETYTYLYFSHRRRYQLLPALTFSPNKYDFYTWSRYNQMNLDELYNSSKIGDEAYLITHKGKIIYVYFVKFFKASKELEEML